jgi:hypothetical protein
MSGSICRSIAEKIIKIIHILIILFIVCVPIFSNDNLILTFYVLIVPFMILHWMLNNDSCSLTMLEMYIKTNDINETFAMMNNKPALNELITYKFIGPIYNFNNDYKQFSSFTYIIVILLWMISASKLYLKYKSGNILHASDFLKSHFTSVKIT